MPDLERVDLMALDALVAHLLQRPLSLLVLPEPFREELVAKLGRVSLRPIGLLFAIRFDLWKGAMHDKSVVQDFEFDPCEVC